MAGSRSPLDRLADADTAIKECSFVKSLANACLCSGVQVSAPLLWASANGMKWSMSNLLQLVLLGRLGLQLIFWLTRLSLSQERECYNVQDVIHPDFLNTTIFML